MINKIKEYASLLMPVPDIAVPTGMDEDELKAKIADKTAPEAKACRLGWAGLKRYSKFAGGKLPRPKPARPWPLS
jgi:hypothetical protein